VNSKCLQQNNKNQKTKCPHFTSKTLLTNKHCWAKKRWEREKRWMIMLLRLSLGLVSLRIFMIMLIIRSTQSLHSTFISRIFRAPFKLWAIRNTSNKNMTQVRIQGRRRNFRPLWNPWTLINLAFPLRRWWMAIKEKRVQELRRLETARQWITMLKVLVRNWDFQMKWNRLIFLDQFRRWICRLKSRDCANQVDVWKEERTQGLISWLIRRNYRRCHIGISILREEDTIHETKYSRIKCTTAPRLFTPPV